MELKRFQKDVIADLTRFLALLSEKRDIPRAYETFWHEKNVPIGFTGLPPYRTEIPGVPDVCLKVPTGGGKTFIACSAIKPIFDAFPFVKAKAVVWLVPSDAILEQTYKALSDADHPYRQRINTDFENRVEVYSKQQLLSGQDFSPTTVRERLSIFVLSYDSFRISKKEGRKAYQENGYLAPFARYADPETLLEEADETALIQAIRSLAPIVIVDESHHATSDLSVEMLRNFNPSFILDLTATPKSNSNVISYVDAVQLKREHMVKLPVIVYNRKTQSDVFLDAITIRGKLEEQAKIERSKTGRYIRPIVLLQAQPRGKEKNTTFEKVRHMLIEMGIPEAWIAIKTAQINELKNVDLLSEDCPIRFIITINALKEGWDCPFAYVLATIANRTSTVDVEQILGRVLRLPYTAKNESRMLNISYVLTSSNDFRETLDRVITALNRAGFSDRDYRAKDIETTVIETPAAAEQLELPTDQDDDIPEVDVARVREFLDNQDETEKQAEGLVASAMEQAGAYEAAFAQMDDDFQFTPMEVADKMNIFRMQAQFEEEAKALRIPQFFISAPPSLFSDSEYALLDSSRLSRGFSLRGKDTGIDFSTLDTEIAEVDVAEGKDTKPRAFDLSSRDSVYIKEWFNSLPPESRLHHCMGIIYKQLSKNDAIDDKELKDYIKLVIDGFSPDQLADLEQSPYPYVYRFEKKIETLLEQHRKDTFDLWIEQGTIICRPSYALKTAITPVKHTGVLPKCLYSEEEDMNDLEYEIARRLAALGNVKWWHRNIARREFNINGFINMYPDFIVMTNRGAIIMVEPKGTHLENSESRKKVALGRTWEHKAGDGYRYYMVFRETDLAIDGAVQLDRFMEIVKGL